MNSAFGAFGIGWPCRLWPLVLIILLPLQGAAAESSEGEAPSGGFLAHRYVPPGHASMKPPRYPTIPLRDGMEGWVQLNFMVDRQGKAYEIAVVDSFGHESFEGAAARAVAKGAFEPASLDGEPIDAGHAMKIVFQQREGRRGASPKFATGYRKLMKLIDERRQSEAGEQLAQLESRKKRNLYEDAFLNFARYRYFRLWGDPSQQLRALDRAVAYEATNRFLPEQEFTFALLAHFHLLVETRDYARALAAYRHLGSFFAPRSKFMLDLKGLVDRIEALRTDDTSYQVPGKIARDGSWHYSLLKNEFAVRDLEGRIAEVKLRCGGSYYLFPFDADKSYRVSGSPMPCHLQFVGDPGTTFGLLQMGGAEASTELGNAALGS